MAPFLAFIAIFGLPPQVLQPARLLVAGGILLFFSRRYLSLRAAFPLASIAVGIAVFAIWIAPDLLFGYRHRWMFENALTGRAVSSIPPALRRNAAFLAVRAANCVLLVPVLEELFWRGWLMRWLIDRDFLRVPLGKFAPAAFWLVALLFASEHGPYWEVGLAAGIVYNWWIVRTRSLADCILAHAVTNALLSTYVSIGNQWQYWL